MNKKQLIELVLAIAKELERDISNEDAESMIDDFGYKEEEDTIKITKDYWVVEFKSRTLSHITSIKHLDDPSKWYIDIIQDANNEHTFIRMPKNDLTGIYKKI